METALAAVLFYSLQTNQRGGDHHIEIHPHGYIPHGTYKEDLQQILDGTRGYGDTFTNSHANMPLNNLSEEDIKGIYYEVQDLAEALEEDEMEQNWTVNYGEPWRHPLSLPHISDLDEFLSYIYVPNMVKRHIEEHYDKDTGLRKIPDVVQERFITEIN